MRVTIEHREATSGVLGKHTESYVDCTVQFSEEERAIVQARDLYREGFFVRTSTPLPSQGSTLGTNLMRGFPANSPDFAELKSLRRVRSSMKRCCRSSPETFLPH